MDARSDADEAARAPGASAVSLRGVGCRLEDVEALVDVDLEARPGEIRALLGPNGAGKTTVLRVACGFLRPTVGRAFVLGAVPAVGRRLPIKHVGYVPSGNRSVYLRLSGEENLLFFGRLHGLRPREARATARERLAAVGLEHAAHRRAGTYSQGMLRRLVVARALLTDPRVLLVDEATHDLDPEGAETIRHLVLAAARRGAAVLWATQRLDETRGFADSVTMLNQGRVRFSGSIAALIAVASTPRFLLRVLDNGAPTHGVATELQTVASHAGLFEPAGPDHVLLTLAPSSTLGEALATLVSHGFSVLSCREERSSLELALRDLAQEPQAVPEPA